MKKVSMIFGTAFIASMIFTSCTKDWVCECKTNDNAFSASRVITGTKSEAKADCEKDSGSAMGFTVECKLK